MAAPRYSTPSEENVSFTSDERCSLVLRGGFQVDGVALTCARVTPKMRCVSVTEFVL